MTTKRVKTSKNVFSSSHVTLISRDPFKFTWGIPHNKNRISKRMNELRNKQVKKDVQVPVNQTLDSAIHRINHYPADKY